MSWITVALLCFLCCRTVFGAAVSIMMSVSHTQFTESWFCGHTLEIDGCQKLVGATLHASCVETTDPTAHGFLLKLVADARALGSGKAA